MRYKTTGYDNYEPPPVELYLKIRGVHLLLRKSYNGYYSRGGVSFAHAVLTDSPNFSKHTASSLREQGYVVSEDARGARFAATPGKASELSSSDVVKYAAELDGGVKPQANLPICGECQSASPVGAENCQWCGQPFPA